MSTRSDRDGLGGSALDIIERWYQIPVLVGLMTLMLVVRIQSYGNFIRDGEPLLGGNDPWYHYRETSYVVENFPFTMPFDPWTNYPSGHNPEQFGTLVDQITGGAILALGLGDPTSQQAAIVMVIAAPIMATLAIIPAYVLARQFTGKFPALVGVSVIALLPGTFLNYSLAGFYDHHAFEVFFQTIAVLAFIVALSVAEREKPVWELVIDRDVEALKRPVGYSALAGVAAGLYMWAWPPGILLVGFTGIFFALKITTDVYHGDSPEPIAFVGAVSLTVTGLMMLVPLNEFSIGGATSYSLLQVLLPIGVAAGCVFLAFLAREWESRDQTETAYVGTVFGLIVASVVVVRFAIPSLYRTIEGNVLNIIAFSASDTTQTIGEAQAFLTSNPRASPFQIIFSEYGLAFITAVAAALYLIGRPLYTSDDTSDTIYLAGGVALIGLVLAAFPSFSGAFETIGISWQLLGLAIALALLIGAALRVQYDAATFYLLTWAGFITATAFTQTRFNYYLAIVVGILNAIFIAEVLGYLDLRGSPREVIDGIEGWQVMAVVTAFLLITAPLVFAVPSTAWDRGAESANQPGEVVAWEDSMDFLEEETPAPGELEGHDNRMEYYGTYEIPEGDHDYPDGAYGVQSWWDYGHWITTQGERIPNANPFQQGATDAANYLLAPSEDRAESALEEKMGESGETRYVMVDWQMVSPASKFSAPVVWYDEEDISQGDFIQSVYPQQGEQFGQPISLREQRYYESQMVRLYEFHGSAVDPAPIVTETQQQNVETQAGGQVTIEAIDVEGGVQEFDSLEEAQAYADENPGAEVGGIGPNPTERVEALEHYRLVKSAESPASFSNSDFQQQVQLMQQANVSGQYLARTSPQWVKTFERVPGATVEGSGAPAESEVTAQVQMRDQTTNSTFTYTQYATADENGNFEMTLPYSTTGYDEFGPENGYTNVSVTAEDDYVFTAIDEDANTSENPVAGQFVGEAAVEEAQVVGEDDSAVTVELETPEVETNSDDSANESIDPENQPIGSDRESLSAVAEIQAIA